VTTPSSPQPLARVGVDIGGTFTDVALELDGVLHSTKTTPSPSVPSSPGCKPRVSKPGLVWIASASSFTARRWRPMR